MNSEKRKAILCIISAAFCFALMNLFVKLSGELPVWQKSFFRNAVAVIVAGILLKQSGLKLKVGKENYLWLFIRCTAGTIGILFNFYAISQLNIADASMLNKLSPFFAIIFSIPIIKEKPKKTEWAAVIIAFIGALFVIRPTFDIQTFPGFLGMLSGMSAGLAYACVRKLGQNGVKGPVIVFSFSLFSSLSVLPGVLFTYEPMTAFQWFSLVMAGISGAGGQFSITTAYTKAPAKEISVFDYTQVIFATIFSMVLLSDFPDVLSYVGYAVIIGVAVFKWRLGMKE